MLSPFHKNINFIEPAKKKLNTETRIEVHENNKTKYPKHIVLLTDSFLPVTYAGSELSAYETIKYLHERGHTISVLVKNWKVPSYNGLDIFKYNMNDSICKNILESCDLIFFQMGDTPENLRMIQDINKPVYAFIHVVQGYPWLLQDRLSFPVTVVYNSHMTQDTMPTIHKNIRMIPYVDMRQLKPLRSLSVQNDTVCLINCNRNKGGELFRDLAYKMPAAPFLGVKGGYSNQVVDTTLPANLRYIETQNDMTKVFNRIGILVMPSHHETWGRTAVEAMAAGIPVIHSEAAGLVECVAGAGIMCNRDDEDAWAEAIRRILGDRAYRERIRQNGFRRVEEIDIEQRRGRNELAVIIETP